MSTPDPTPTPLPAAPTPEAAAAMGAQGGPPSEAERLAFEAWMRGHSWPVAGAWNGTTYIGSADLDPLCLVDTAAMQTRLLWAAWRDRAALATPPAATRKAEHDDGDDAIDRWVDGKSDWIANWGAPRSDIAALIGEALEHWGRSATREAGPLPQAPPTEEDLYDLAEAFNGDPVPAMRRALELWGGAAVPVPVSERLPGPEDCDAEDRCWLCGKVEGDWRLMSVVNPGVPHLKYCFSHWLPHWALPVPAAAAGEVQP